MSISELIDDDFIQLNTSTSIQKPKKDKLTVQKTNQTVRLLRNFFL